MEVSQEIFNWLQNFDSSIHGDKVSPTTCMLGRHESAAMENGSGFASILIGTVSGLDASEVQNTLKDAQSPSIRLGNWNYISKVIRSIGVEIDADTKALIVAGDSDVVADILSQIYNSKQQTKQPKARPTPSPKIQSKGGAPASIQLDEISSEKDYQQTSNCLELLLVSFMKHFEVNPKQAAGLLTQSNKYLAHIIAKGLKGDFACVISWFEDLRGNANYLGSLIAAEVSQGSIGLVLAAMRPGFFARSLPVALSCANLFSALGGILQDLGLSDEAWDWFTKEFGGIDAWVLALQKFKGTIRQAIVEVYAAFARGRYSELFRTHLRRVFSEVDDFIPFLHQFIMSIQYDEVGKNEIYQSGLLDQWVAGADDWLKSNLNATKSLAVSMLCEMWVTFPTIFDGVPDMGNNIIKVLKTRIRVGSRIQKQHAISQLFRLLSHFSASLNASAPVVYKTLTFSLVENHSDEILREIFLSNFSQLFSEIASIPVGIIIDPIAKLLSLEGQTSYSYGAFDFTFFAELARHPRLTIKNGLIMLDLLGKIYLNDLAYSHAAAVPFMLIANRFLDQDAIVEYLYRFSSFGLDQILEQEKLAKTKKMKKEKITIREIESEMVPLQTRNNILDMVSHIIQLESDELNPRMKNLLLAMNNRIKRLSRRNYKGIMVLLSLIGDPERLLNQYESTKLSPKPRDRALVPKAENPMLSRAESHLEKMKMKKMEKAQKIQEEQERFAQKDKVVRRSMKKQINKRRVELGVTLNNEVVHKGNSANLEQKKYEIKIVDLEDESDIETVNIVLARYNHLLKYLFKRYVGTGYNSRKTKQLGLGTFESHQKNIRAIIIESEIYKILTDHGVTNRMLTYKDFHKLMAMYMHANGKSDQINQADFPTFKQIMLQTAIAIYSKQEQYLGFLPAGFSLLEMIFYFRNHKFEKGENISLFDDPDPGAGDRDVVNRVNKELLYNPEAEIPENYVKIDEWEIDVEYNLPEPVYLHPTYKLVLEVLDGIMFDALGNHILEPQVVHYQYSRVRGVMKRPEASSKVASQRSRKSSQDVKPLPSPRSTAESGLEQGAQLQLAQVAPQMRFLVAKQLNQTTEKKVTIEVANWLEKKLHQLELNEWEYKPPKGNKVLEERHNKAVEAQAAREQAEAKRWARMRAVKEKMAYVAHQKAQIEVEESLKKKVHDAAMTRYHQEMKEYNDQMKLYKEHELKQWKQKKEQEKQAQVEEVKTKSTPQTTKEDRKKFWNLQRIKLKKVDETLKKQRDAQQKELEKKQLKATITRKSNLEKHKAELDEGRNKKKEDETLEQELKEFYNSREVQATIIMYEPQLDTLYAHYNTTQGFDLDGKQGVNEYHGKTGIQFKTFNRFAMEFNIYPGIVSDAEVANAFRHMNIGKAEGKLAPIDKNEFIEALFRISIQGYEKLQVFVGKTWSELSFEMFEALILWLELPKNPTKINEKLNNMQSKHPAEKKKEAALRSKAIPAFTQIVSKHIQSLALKPVVADSPNKSIEDVDLSRSYEISPF